MTTGSLFAEIESASVESLEVTIRATADPTGDAVEFVLTAEADTSPSGTWQAGTWGTWSSPYAVATTPTLGAAGATISMTEGDRNALWCRIGSAVVFRVGTVEAT